jgi:hypothetical protein
MAQKSRINKQTEAMEKVARVFDILKMEANEIVLVLEMLLNQYEETSQKIVQTREDLQ